MNHKQHKSDTFGLNENSNREILYDEQQNENKNSDYSKSINFTNHQNFNDDYINSNKIRKKFYDNANQILDNSIFSKDNDKLKYIMNSKDGLRSKSTIPDRKIAYHKYNFSHKSQNNNTTKIEPYELLTEMTKFPDVNINRSLNSGQILTNNTNNDLKDNDWKKNIQQKIMINSLKETIENKIQENQNLKNEITLLNKNILKIENDLNDKFIKMKNNQEEELFVLKNKTGVLHKNILLDSNIYLNHVKEEIDKNNKKWIEKYSNLEEEQNEFKEKTGFIKKNIFKKNIEWLNQMNLSPENDQNYNQLDYKELDIKNQIKNLKFVFNRNIEKLKKELEYQKSFILKLIEKSVNQSYDKTQLDQIFFLENQRDELINKNEDNINNITYKIKEIFKFFEIQSQDDIINNLEKKLIKFKWLEKELLRKDKNIDIIKYEQENLIFDNQNQIGQLEKQIINQKEDIKNKKNEIYLLEKKFDELNQSHNKKLEEFSKILEENKRIKNKIQNKIFNQDKNLLSLDEQRKNKSGIEIIHRNLIQDAGFKKFEIFKTESFDNKHTIFKKKREFEKYKLELIDQDDFKLLIVNQSNQDNENTNISQDTIAILNEFRIKWLKDEVE